LDGFVEDGERKGVVKNCAYSGMTLDFYPIIDSGG